MQIMVQKQRIPQQPPSQQHTFLEIFKNLPETLDNINIGATLVVKNEFRHAS